MFNDADFQIAFAPAKSEAQLVMIQIDDEHGILAVAKSYGLGQVSCIAFAPATKLDRPLENFRPQFLRKAVTNDFALRAGTWKAVPLESNNAIAMRNSAMKVLETVEKMDPEAIQTIDMERPSNISSAPDVAQTTYRASEHTPFEQALVHLLGVQIAQSAAQVQQQNDENAA